MGLDNPIHIAFLLILLLLVFGAKRLPELGKSLGAGMRGFKDSLTGEGSQTSLNPPPSAPVASAKGTVIAATSAEPVTAEPVTVAPATVAPATPATAVSPSAREREASSAA